MVTQGRWGYGLAAGEAADLLAAASVQFWRAPELTGLLAGKVAVTTEVDSAVVLAEGLRAAAEGIHHGGLEAALDGVRLACEANERELEAVLRIELAGVARTAGLPKVGLALLRPALVAGHSSGVLGVALAAAAATLAPWRWRDELSTVLANAERLCILDDRLDAESSTLARADVLATAAATMRVGGDAAAAAGFARQGLRALEDAPAAVASGTGRVARLRLELLLALPAAGGDGVERAQLVRAATRGVFEPVRAPAAASTAWLAHAVATRVAPEECLRAPDALLAEAMHIAERHQAYDVLAAAARELAVLQEQAGAAGAGRSVRAADFAAAQQRRRMATIREQLVRAYPGQRPRSVQEDDAPFAEEMDGAVTDWADIADPDRVIDELLTFAVEVGGFAPPSVTAAREPAAPEVAAAQAPETEPPQDTAAEPVARAGHGSGPDAAAVRAGATETGSAERGAGSGSASGEPEPGAVAASSPGGFDTGGAAAGEQAPPGLSHVTGLVVAEGTGGRRRAPETVPDPGSAAAASGSQPAARPTLEQEAWVSIPESASTPGSWSAEAPVAATPAEPGTPLEPRSPDVEAVLPRSGSEPLHGDEPSLMADAAPEGAVTTETVTTETVTTETAVPEEADPEAADPEASADAATAGTATVENDLEAEEPSADTALGFVDLLTQAMDAYHRRTERADQDQPQEHTGSQDPWHDREPSWSGSAADFATASSFAGEPSGVPAESPPSQSAAAPAPEADTSGVRPNGSQDAPAELASRLHVSPDGPNGTHPVSNEIPLSNERSNEHRTMNGAGERGAPGDSESGDAEAVEHSCHATVTELGAFTGSDENRFDARRIPRHRKPDPAGNGSGSSPSGTRNGSKHGMPGRQSWYSDQAGSDRWDSAGSAD